MALKRGDFRPYLLVSNDRGRTWEARATGMSQRAALLLNEVLALPAFIETLPDGEEMAAITLVPFDEDFEAYLAMVEANNPRLQETRKQIEAIEQLLKAAAVTSILPEGFAMRPRMPPSWRICSTPPRAPEWAIRKIGFTYPPGRKSFSRALIISVVICSRA